VTLWDVYMTHYRHAGKKRWQQLVRSGEGLGEDAYSRLLAEPAPLRWGLAEELCKTSRQRAAQDPKEALGLAEIAGDLAKVAPVNVAGERARHELLALTWACAANAHRNADHLEEARAAMHEAGHYLQEGHPLLLGLMPNILSFRASIEFWERRYEDSLATIDSALSHNPVNSVRPRLLVQRSNLLTTVFDRALEGLAALDEAVPIIDQRSEPRLWLAAVVQQLLVLTQLGRMEEAEALLPQVRGLAGASPADRIQLRWIEARLAYGQGRQDRAEMLYHEITRGFLQHNLAFSAAVVTLELCHFLMEQGRLEEVATLAASTLEEFHRQKVHPEFVSALALVEQAVLGQNLTLEVLAKARTLLHHS
jgi:tetratricopeptide (TPR) repeat protein